MSDSEKPPAATTGGPDGPDTEPDGEQAWWTAEVGSYDKFATGLEAFVERMQELHGVSDSGVVLACERVADQHRTDE